MKKIYLILTHTGTILSRIIKIYTKDEFTHVSIALDEELDEMYSFGRLNPYNPFIGGFVHENINYGTFKRFKYTQANIYSLEIDDNQYNKLKGIINYIKLTKNLHKFNIIGLIAVGFHKKIQSNDSFYCAEFVKYVLEKSEIINELPDTIKPEDFKDLENANLIFQGKLRDYNKDKINLLEKMKLVNSRKAVI